MPASRKKSNSNAKSVKNTAGKTRRNSKNKTSKKKHVDTYPRRYRNTSKTRKGSDARQNRRSRHKTRVSGPVTYDKDVDPSRSESGIVHPNKYNFERGDVYGEDTTTDSTEDTSFDNEQNYDYAKGGIIDDDDFADDEVYPRGRMSGPAGNGGPKMLLTKVSDAVGGFLGKYSKTNGARTLLFTLTFTMPTLLYAIISKGVSGYGLNWPWKLDECKLLRGVGNLMGIYMKRNSYLNDKELKKEERINNQRKFHHDLKALSTMLYSIMKQNRKVEKTPAVEPSKANPPAKPEKPKTTDEGKHPKTPPEVYDCLRDGYNKQFKDDMKIVLTWDAPSNHEEGGMTDHKHDKRNWAEKLLGIETNAAWKERSDPKFWTDDMNEADKELFKVFPTGRNHDNEDYATGVDIEQFHAAMKSRDPEWDPDKLKSEQYKKGAAKQ